MADTRLMVAASTDIRRWVLFAASLLSVALTACAPLDDTRATQADPQPRSTAPPVAAIVEAKPNAKPALPPEACTREGAWEFFRQFVSRREVRDAHNRIGLKPNGSAAGFDGFRIGLVDNRWVYVDPTLSEADYPRLRLSGAREGDAFRVEYVKAKYAPNDDLLETYGQVAVYTFEFRNECWALTRAAP